VHREVGNYRSKADLIALYERLAMVLQPICYTSDDPQTREYRQKALQLRQELGAHLDRGDGRRSTAQHLAATGSLLLASKQYSDARNHFLQAQEIFQELAEKTGSVQARQELARIYGNLASISLSREESEEHHRAAMAIWNTLLEETGRPDIQVHLSDCCHFLSRIRREAGDCARANAFCREALEHIQAAVQAVPIPEYQYILASRWDSLGHMEKAAGNLTAAKDAYRTALKIRQEVCQNTMNSSWNVQAQTSVQYESAPACRALTESLHNLIPLCYRTGQIQEAQQYAQQLMHICEVVLKYSHTPAARIELGRSCAALAALDAMQKDASSAEVLFQKAASLFASAAAEENTPTLRRMQGRCYFDLGKLMQTRDPKKALTYFRTSHDLYEPLIKQTQAAEDQQMLALVLHQTGLLSLDTAPIHRACEILEQLIRRDPNNQEYPQQLKHSENTLRRVKLLHPLSGLFGK
jgi:tetratricopeptide (TPR) repeat protein